jgi:hypothetical protein
MEISFLRDKTRPRGTPPLPESVRQKVLTKTGSEMPPSATHWSVRMMANAVSAALTARCQSEVGSVMFGHGAGSIRP